MKKLRTQVLNPVNWF